VLCRLWAVIKKPPMSNGRRDIRWLVGRCSTLAD
jgi:hypothetical protein